MPNWHLTFSAANRETLFPEEAKRRLAVRKVVQLTAGKLLLYSLVDDHLHVAVALGNAPPGQTARGLNHMVRRLSGLRMNRSDETEVSGRAHLTRLVRYFVTQPRHHELRVHPALWTGSCFQDLVGARYLGEGGLKIWEALPRLRVETVLSYVGLTEADLISSSELPLRQLGIHRIVQAAESVLAVGPGLRGNASSVILARRAVNDLARGAGFWASDIARELGCRVRTLSRYLDKPVGSTLRSCIRRRLAIEVAVQRIQSNQLG